MDAINPNYYKSQGFDLNVDFITKNELNFNEGNFIKYVYRAGNKGDEIQDLEKAIAYIEFQHNYVIGSDKKFIKTGSYEFDFIPNLTGYKKDFFITYCNFNYDNWSQYVSMLMLLRSILRVTIKDLQNESKTN